jgi:hypothetical protein
MTSEAQRLWSIARELEAEADLTDPAAMERVEAYARLAEAAESSEPDEKGHKSSRRVNGER